jgi:GT2 family glycosyltransferase
MVKISVVIPTYRYDNFLNLQKAVESLKAGTVVPEIIIAVGGDILLFEKAKTLRCDEVVLDPENIGASYARNIGAERVTGEIVAFMDDDEIADQEWCEHLISPYSSPKVGGVGGKNLALWECPVPHHLPEEMYWLIGVTHRGFAPENAVCPIRNTFAGNMSFRTEVFKKIGGFNPSLGGKLHNPCEEPEICTRMCRETGLLFCYNPAAKVYNRVEENKTRMGYLLTRAYWQGYMKRQLSTEGYSLAVERGFLGTVRYGVVHRFKNPSLDNWSQIVSLVILTGATGLGYCMKCLSGRT